MFYYKWQLISHNQHSVFVFNWEVLTTFWTNGLKDARFYLQSCEWEYIITIKISKRFGFTQTQLHGQCNHFHSTKIVSYEMLLAYCAVIMLVCWNESEGNEIEAKDQINGMFGLLVYFVLAYIEERKWKCPLCLHACVSGICTPRPSIKPVPIVTRANEVKTSCHGNKSLRWLCDLCIWMK